MNLSVSGETIKIQRSTIMRVIAGMLIITPALWFTAGCPRAVRMIRGALPCRVTPQPVSHQ